MHSGSDRIEPSAGGDVDTGSRRISDILDRGVPDETETGDLPPVLAAEVDHLAGRTCRWMKVHDEVHWGVRARAAASVDDVDLARRLLRRGIVEEPDTVDEWPTHGLSSASWAASRVGDAEQLSWLAQRLGSVDVEFLRDGDVPLGPRSMFTGMVAAALGDLDAAIGELGHAVTVGDRRSPLWGALARYELARVLACRGDLGEVDATRTASGRSLIAASTFFSASGCRHLGAMAAEVGSATPSWCARAEPGRATLYANDLGGWTLGFGVQPSVHSGHALGLVAIAHLVRHRDRGVPAIELSRVLDRAADRAERGSAVQESSTPALWRSLGLAGLSDPSQIQALINDDTARSRVSKLLRRTVTAISDQHTLLGDHLRATVRTGYVCRYESSGELTWRL